MPGSTPSGCGPNFWVFREGELTFLGLDNFIELFGDSIFLQTLQNSLVFSSASVALKAILGLTLALLLNRTLRFNKLIRGALLLPFVVPTALSTLGWWWMFDSLYSVINWSLVHLGLAERGPAWLSNPYLAMLSVIIVNTWRGLPFFRNHCVGRPGLHSQRALRSRRNGRRGRTEALLAHHPAAAASGIGGGCVVLDHFSRWPNSTLYSC